MTYFDRASWGALAPKSTTLFGDNLPNSSTVHWVGAPVGFKADYRDTVRSIQAHAFSKGLADIDYNFLVDVHGNVYEGRGALVRSGAQHVGNSTSLAICYLEPDTVTFSPQAQQAIVDLNKTYARSGIIHPHRFWNNGGKYDTFCPGDKIAIWCDAISKGTITVTPEPAPVVWQPQEEDNDMDKIARIPYLNQLHAFWVNENGHLKHKWDGADGKFSHEDLSAILKLGKLKVTKPNVGITPNLDLVVGVFGTDDVFNDIKWDVQTSKWTQDVAE